jgi:hypothetical protein
VIPGCPSLEQCSRGSGRLADDPGNTVLKSYLSPFLVFLLFFDDFVGSLQSYLLFLGKILFFEMSEFVFNVILCHLKFCVELEMLICWMCVLKLMQLQEPFSGRMAKTLVVI